MRFSRVDFTNKATTAGAHIILPYAGRPYRHAELLTRITRLACIPVSVGHRLLEDSTVGMVYFPYEGGRGVLSLSGCPVKITAFTRLFVV